MSSIHQNIYSPCHPVTKSSIYSVSVVYLPCHLFTMSYVDHHGPCHPFISSIHKSSICPLSQSPWLSFTLLLIHYAIQSPYHPLTLLSIHTYHVIHLPCDPVRLMVHAIHFPCHPFAVSASHHIIPTLSHPVTPR